MMTRGESKAVVLGASVQGGTGWVAAETLAARGYRTAVGARRIGPVSQLAQSIGGTAHVCDATIESDISAMAAAVAADGPIDVAVLVAGEGVSGDIDTIADDELDHAIRLNFLAGVYFIRHMARHMRDGGAIVVMSSIAASRAWPGYFAYGSAKAALEMLVRYAALEYGHRRIRVNAISPGPIAKVPDAAPAPIALTELVDSTMPLGCRVTQAEIADALLWLVGAGSTTGDVLHLDGGMHLTRPPNPSEVNAAAAR